MRKVSLFFKKTLFFKKNINSNVKKRLLNAKKILLIFQGNIF